MRKLELKIEKCGDCPYCLLSDDYDGYQCVKLWDGGAEAKAEWDTMRDDCPLPLYIEGQKELFQ